MIDAKTVRARRQALIAQLERGRQQYDELEAALRALDRNLCAMAGGVQELDALLAEIEKVELLERMITQPAVRS